MQHGVLIVLTAVWLTVQCSHGGTLVDSPSMSAPDRSSFLASFRSLLMWLQHCSLHSYQWSLWGRFQTSPLWATISIPTPPFIHWPSPSGIKNVLVCLSFSLHLMEWQRCSPQIGLIVSIWKWWSLRRQKSSKKERESTGKGLQEGDLFFSLAHYKSFPVAAVAIQSAGKR